MYIYIYTYVYIYIYVCIYIYIQMYKHICHGQNMIYGLWSSIPQWEQYHGYMNPYYWLDDPKTWTRRLGMCIPLSLWFTTYNPYNVIQA